jgi:hypothetical protein
MQSARYKSSGLASTYRNEAMDSDDKQHGMKILALAGQKKNIQTMENFQMRF